MVGLLKKLFIHVLLGFVGTGCVGSWSHQVEQTAATVPGFVEVTESAGLGTFKHKIGATGQRWLPETTGAGGGFIDYNKDGWLDILLVGGGALSDSLNAVPAVVLYRNNKDGTFTAQTETAGLAKVAAYGMGVTAADYDNDGDEDFYLTALRKNKLFRNDNGVFHEVAGPSGVAGDSVWSTAAVFFDADRDGWLDLYVGGYVEWPLVEKPWCTVDGVHKSYCEPTRYPGLSGRFYHNNGDGSFSDQTKRVGLHTGPGRTFGVVELDFNKDGWSDLAVANDMSKNQLFVNNGKGGFTEWGEVSGIAYSQQGVARAGMGIDAGVVDHTGQETVFIGNFSEESIGVFHHAGGGLFVDRAEAANITPASFPTLTFGLFLFDSDLDTDLDLLAANGHVQPDIDKLEGNIGYRQPPQLFLNQGRGYFEDKTSVLGKDLQQPMVGRGAAYGDYDQDGDLDVLITENGGPVHLLQNSASRENNFLRVVLEGQTSNRSGIGARLTAVVGAQRMYRRVRAGSSYLSSSEKVITFGLGSAQQVDTLYISWPSGKMQHLNHVAANQRIKVTEDTSPKAYTLAD